MSALAILLVMFAVTGALLALVVTVALIVVRGFYPPEREPDWDVSDL